MRLYTTEHGEHIEHYRNAITTVIHNAVHDHPRTLALRVDLHDPSILDNGDTVSCFHNTTPGVMARFINSFNAKCEAYQNRKRNEGKRVYPSTLRYVWVREFSLTGKRHFHTFLFLNKDAFYNLGSYDLDEYSLRTMITTAWCSAQGLTPEEGCDLVQYPYNGRYVINQPDIQLGLYPADLLNRIDYLTKTKSKVYDDGYRSFGCSNK